MLLTILELRNRMLNCKPSATVSVEFCEEDSVNLIWDWVGEDGEYFRHSIVSKLDTMRVNSRVFERQMHKAKRFLKYQAEVAHG